LHDERFLQSRAENNSIDEESSSWISQIGPPERLNEVYVEAPNAPLAPDDMESINAATSPWIGLPDDDSIVRCWTEGLTAAHARRPLLF
jgi:hypothetical protein